MRKHEPKTLLVLASLLLSAFNIVVAYEYRPEVECINNSCGISTIDDANQPKYAVVSPVGYHAVEMIEQLARLDTLEGKRIALVGGSFMASITHDELKQCIQETYPDAQLFMFDQVGASGAFSVFGKSAQTQAFQRRLQELRIDAVISGNCGCGLCTLKET